MAGAGAARVRADDVAVGGLYVNEAKGKVREILDQRESGNFQWRCYWLATGEPVGDSGVCSAQAVARWADREARPEEGERLNREYAHLLDVARTQDIIAQLLPLIPDDMLRAECVRRGWRVSAR